MTVSFSRTMRAVGQDHFHRAGFILALIVSFVGIWLSWLFFGNVSVFVHSNDARLELASPIHRLQMPVDGRIVVNNMTMGKEVNKGDVLLQLDSRLKQFQLEEARARHASLYTESAALDREIEARTKEWQGVQDVASLEVAKQDVRIRNVAKADIAVQREMEILGKLKDEGLYSVLDYQRKMAEREQLLGSQEVQLLDKERELGQKELRSIENQAEREILLKKKAHLMGELSTYEVLMSRLTYEIEQHTLKAATDGVLGEITPLATGMMMNAHVTIGSLIPKADLLAGAWFEPEDAVGRILINQKAKLRFPGFPWTSYGDVHGHVSQVASEIKDGRIYVIFALDDPGNFPEPLRHGMPCNIEVEIAKLSPIALVTRHLGEKFHKSRQALQRKN